MFFTISKILWFFADPANLILLALSLGGVLGLFRARSARSAGRWLFGGGLLSLALATVLPIGPWAILPLENRFPVPAPLPDQVAGIVVAGGLLDPAVSAARGQVALNGAADRLFAFAELAARYPEAKLIYSAGSGSLTRQDVKEADFVTPLLARLGVPTDRILLENRSRNTHENAVFSRQLAGADAAETWILVTSAFHMPRAVGTFRKAGWSVLPYPTDFQFDPASSAGFGLNPMAGLRQLSAASHEWIGLLAYRLSGRSDAVFPGPER